MSTISNSDGHSVPHMTRTQQDPRAPTLHKATVVRIRQVNAGIRTVRLDLNPGEQPPLSHLPGQYLDVYIPGLANAGGFTITSPPSTTTVPRLARNSSISSTPSPSHHSIPYLTLAIQSSPTNPAATYFFSPFPSTLLGTPLQIRVGGSFVYPPLHLKNEEERLQRLRRRVFIAGGVGINPIMSMVAHIAEEELGPIQKEESKGRIGTGYMGMRGVRVLYSTRVDTTTSTHDPSSDAPSPFIPQGASDQQASNTSELSSAKEEKSAVKGLAGEILFAKPLCNIAARALAMALDFFLTSSGTLSAWSPNPDSGNMSHHTRRMTHADILDAVGQTAEERCMTVVYVCGPPGMTDNVVGWLRGLEGFREDEDEGRGRVLCEKWW